MKYTYKEIINFDGTKTIEATGEDGSVLFIPADESNSDFQEYLNPSAQSKEITTPQGGNK